MVDSSMELQSFPGFRIAIFWDCLHMLRILFTMKHLLSIASNHLLDLGPIFFSCSIKTIICSCVFPSNATTFMYSYLLQAYTMEVSLVAVDSTCRFYVDDMLPLPLLGVGVQLGLQ